MPLTPETPAIPMFFIIGRPRSGTTMLSLLFDAHPHVMIPGECNFILALSRKYKNLTYFDLPAKQQFITDMKGTKYFDTLAINLPQLEQQILDLPAETNFHKLCSLIQLSCHSVYPKEEILMAGDKNPAYSSENFHKVMRIFPDARYIHLVRDYHDHIASMLRGNFRLPSAVYMAIAWKKSLRILAVYKKKYPQQFLSLRYEDLVQQPEYHMQQICHFLQIPYREEMFGFYQKKEEYQANQPKITFEKHHKSLFRPIDKQSIGNWRDVLKGNELSAVELVAGKAGQEWGYESSPRKLNPAIVYSILKWHFHYFVIIILRALVFSLPLKKRYKVVNRYKKNKGLRKLYHLVSRRKITG